VANAGKLDRLSKGILEPRRTRTDLAALVGRVAEEWRQRSGRRLEVTAEPAVTWVDSAKVERVVENLLANAGRHTTPDTPVWVRVARRDRGVLLAVEDAGAGMPRELRATLFEPFHRGPGAAAHAPGSASACPWWPGSPSSTANGRGCRTGPAPARGAVTGRRARRPRGPSRPRAA
jgi:signal transduction histidine kinase